MATEAAILGTPVIRCNSFVGKNDMGNFIELEKKYKLLYSRRDPIDALKLVKKLLLKGNMKKIWNERKEKMLREKIDLTSFTLWFLENYPESVQNAKDYKEMLK